MRAGLGLSTISQRLAGLSNMQQSTRPQAARTATDAAVGQPSFASALSSQLDLQASAAATAAPEYATVGATASGGAVQLGAGVRLTGASSVIVPQAGASQAAVVGVAPTGGAAHVESADHVHDVPALDRSGPPAELRAHGNGRIPADALTPLGVGDHRLWAPAGHAFQDMSAAAAADGVTIGINSSYRSYERQVDMVERYGLYSQGGRAAQPGSSNHGWGVALDLDLNSEAQAWMRANGRDYGFVEDVPREPWHWTFRASSY